MAEAMIERIARAIYEAENGIDGDTIGTMLHENFRIEPTGDDKGLPATMDVCRLAARAAVTAMREPSRAMIRAGTDLALRTSLGGDYQWSDYMRDLNRTFVDALLTEGGRTPGAEG